MLDPAHWRGVRSASEAASVQVQLLPTPAMSLNAATPDLEWPDTLESAATLVRAMNKPPFWGRLAAEALFTASLGHLEQLRRPCRHAKP